MGEERNNDNLSEPFSRIFIDRAEADWAFDLMRETVRWLRVTNPYDQRLAVTLSERSGKSFLRLNFGAWLVLGFRGPGQVAERVDMALLADLVGWDERFAEFSFERKEGEPETRSYELPMEVVRPLTSQLQQAYEATLEVIAEKFQSWSRATHWKQHNPEIVEAFFDMEKREVLLLGGLEDVTLRYERHMTAFRYELAEEEGIYESDLVSIGEDISDDIPAPIENQSYIKHQDQQGNSMKLDQHKIDEMILLVCRWYPNWADFANPAFKKDEIDYKRITIAKAQDLLSEAEFKRLIDKNDFDELIDRLDRIGKDNNLLWRSVPGSGDLNILYDSKLDKSTFCEAMFDLLFGAGESTDRLARYLSYIQSQQLSNKWTFPTYFLFVCHPETEIFVKPRTMKWFVEFFGDQDQYSTNPTPMAYKAIKELAYKLMNELQRYAPQDMVDIQSFIWICYQSLDRNEKLAEPFSRIFLNREEAEWAFDFLQETCERLEIKSPDHPTFALTLARRYGGLNLHFNFGNWLILGFREPSLKRGRIRIPFIANRVNLETDFMEYNFAQRSDEEAYNIISYGLPIEKIRPWQENLKEVYKETLDYIADRFRNYGRSPWRKYNISELAQAIFDLDVRTKLLNDGLVQEKQVINEIEEDELGSKYPLPQLVADIGLDEETLNRWLGAIERKKQVILYGPPGTGKTYLAEKLARYIVSDGDGFWELVQFHPAYAYEDFMQGIRPRSEAGQLSYPLVKGRFLEFCDQARARRDRCVLIIDEINRANLSRVFGELMYLLEYRDRQIPLAGGGLFSIPANARLIGTMNTADRSIALVDHALRRRFAFLALKPNYDLLRRYHEQRQSGFSVEGLIKTLTRLNRQIGDPHYAIGVTFFLHENLAGEIEDIWRMEIEPYLEEYFFDQPDKVDSFRWNEVKAEVLGA